MADGHFLLHITSRQILSQCGRSAHSRSTEILEKTGKIWLVGLLAGVVVYTLAGFLIAPLAIKLWIESPNVSGPTCRLRVQDVYVNPFTMFLSLGNVTLFEQENKLFVSAANAETAVWTVEMFRAEKPGRDVAVRNLVVTSANTGETILTAPNAFARDVAVGFPGGFIDAGYASFEGAVATITRDASGVRQKLGWLSVSGGDRAGACISLDGFQAIGGRLLVNDDAVTPGVQLELLDVVARARRDSRQDEVPTEIDFEARVGAAGSISVKAQLRHSNGRHPDLFSMRARNIDLQPLSPYFRRIFGRGMVARFGDADLRQERKDGTLRLDNRLNIVGLELGDPDPIVEEDTRNLELALALAMDDADRSKFSIQDSVSDSQAQTVFSVFAESVTAHVDRLAVRPFEVLAGLAGDTDALLDEIGFLPGSAEMAPAATDSLAALSIALRQRPRLGLGVRPAYDSAVDRDAIAAQQVRLHIALATSASARKGGPSTEPDFDDPKVQDILDEFADERLSETQRRAIVHDAAGESHRYRDVYRTLVANERVSETVLRRLARFRARSVIDALARDGIDRNRFRITDTLDTMATDAETVSLKVEVEARLPSYDGSTQNIQVP